MILSTADHCELSKQRHARRLRCLSGRGLPPTVWRTTAEQAWREPPRDGRHIAFLQYTSGSTSSPKGVMLSHENLLHNAAVIQQAFGNTPEGQGVSWLPLYHDMGLIGGVVQPVYCGARCALLAPVAFLQRPALWLETISKTQASVSGGPDFAYDLCVRKIPAKERDGLDLSSWKVAFTGAERIRAATIDGFPRRLALADSAGRRFSPATGWRRRRLWCRAGRGRPRPPSFACLPTP